ncbi:hypothetical protein H0H87_012689 [Tephrocybe sp. NHM501043]|nr:hypothetical protein H0H87_012689 [Tephrocybe sp. NHM501043]
MAEDDLLNNLDLYESFLDGVPYIYGALMVESLLFGIQFVLFCICVYLLATKQSPAHLVVMLCIIAMYLISIADMVVSFRYATHDVAGVIKRKTDIRPIITGTVPKGYLYVTNK